MCLVVLILKLGTCNIVRLQYCVVSENSHIRTTEGLGNSEGVFFFFFGGGGGGQ